MNRFIVNVVVVMAVWIAGCAIADYVIQQDTRAWSMWWGYLVGSVSVAVGQWAVK